MQNPLLLPLVLRFSLSFPLFMCSCVPLLLLLVVVASAAADLAEKSDRKNEADRLAEQRLPASPSHTEREK